MDILHDTNFWVAVSFVIFAGLVIKFGRGAINALLDRRIEEIRNEIKSAEAC